MLAEGTPDELKDRVGGERLEITLGSDTQVPDALDALRALSDDRPVVEREVIDIGVRQRGGAIADAVGRLLAAGVVVEDISLRRPTLDDVFLALTGHGAEDGSEPASGPRRSKRTPRQETR